MAKAKKTEDEVRSDKLSAGDLFYIEQSGDKSFEEIAQYLDKPLADVRAYGLVVMEKERNQRNKLRIQGMSNSYKGTVSATPELSEFNQPGNPWGDRQSFASKDDNSLAAELASIDAQIAEAVSKQLMQDAQKLMKKRNDMEVEYKNRSLRASKYESSVHKPFDD